MELGLGRSIYSTILYYVYMRNINITLQLLHSELPYILLNFDFLYYQCRVAWNVGIYPFASQGYNVSHAISASPPLMDFPAGYFAVVGCGGGRGVWQVGQAQGRKWWFNKLSTCTKTKKTRPRGVFLVLVQNFSARGLVQKPSKYSLSSSTLHRKKNKKTQKSLHLSIKKFLWLFLFNNSLEPTN